MKPVSLLLAVFGITLHLSFATATDGLLRSDVSVADGEQQAGSLFRLDFIEGALQARAQLQLSAKAKSDLDCWMHPNVRRLMRQACRPRAIVPPHAQPRQDEADGPSSSSKANVNVDKDELYGAKSRLALAATNCFLAQSGLPTHECPDVTPLEVCTRSFGQDARAFNAFITFTTHIDNVCLTHQREAFQEATEGAVNSLYTATASTAHQLRSFASDAQNVLSSVRTQHSALSEQIDQLSQVRRLFCCRLFVPLRRCQ